MQKKPGQISANTLNLRFMQNATIAKEAREAEAAKARVKSQEEWEIPPSVRQSWGIVDSAVETQGTVTYEESYLPFLFPALSNLHGVAALSSSNNKEPTLSDESDADDKYTPLLAMKGRRTFGKHGKEEIEESPSVEPSQPSPSINGAVLPRGARAISSHGRAAVTPLSSTRDPPKLRTMSHPAQPPPPQQAASMKSSTPRSPPKFMKPPVDLPREESGDRAKRSSVDTLQEDRQRKKRRKQKDTN